MLVYIAIFVGFLVIVTILQKLNNSTVNRAVKTAQDDPSFSELAQALHCSLEKVELGDSGKKTIFNFGQRIAGRYRGHPLEIMMAGRTDHYAEGLDTGYTYTSEKYIKVGVNTPTAATLDITVANPAVQHHPTGHPAFDQHLSLVGNVTLSPSTLGSLAAYPWMNLYLKQGELVLRDTFYDNAPGATNPLRARSAMNKPHPIWGNTATQPTIKPEQSKAFVDLMIDIAEELEAPAASAG